MKKYILKKDLPYSKTGDIFSEGTGKRNGISEITLASEDYITTLIWKSDIDNFEEWFEEIQEYFYIDSRGDIEYSRNEQNEDVVEDHKLIGNYFETKEAAEKYLEYLKAKEVIRKDTKGFKPDWEDKNEFKFFGYWKSEKEELDYGFQLLNKVSLVFFKTEEDIKESFEKHPEEWKIYLTYEQ